MDYEGNSSLVTACLTGYSVEIVQMVLDSLNDSLPLPQNFTQLLRSLVAANEEITAYQNEILDCLASHMLEKLSFGYDEDVIKQHRLFYSLEAENMLEIGVTVLLGPKKLDETESGAPETFSLGSWDCIFWALSESREIRILTHQPTCKKEKILAQSQGSCITIFASWDYLKFLNDKLVDHRLPKSCTSTCFKSWDELFEKEFSGLKKHTRRKCTCNKKIQQLTSLTVWT